MKLANKMHRMFDKPLVANLRAINIAFDPSNSIHYKVIFVHQIPSSQSDQLIKIDIYS